MSDIFHVPQDLLDAVSAYPALETNAAYGKHRKAVMPGEEPRFLIPGKRRKGGISWNDKKQAYAVGFSSIAGDLSTLRAPDFFARWNIAMSEYREHDRMVMEKMQNYVARHAENV